MLFKLHYWLVTAGWCSLNILLGVYINTYTDASTLELGVLLMLMPLTGIIFRPIICSMADRSQKYQKWMMLLTALVCLNFSPFIIVPFLGPQVYEQHPRVCWYILLVVKVLGDIAFGGVLSIGDSLAINYAERTGNEFRSYRIWGSLSWMTFGLIIGQVNEVYFLPKYVPAFMILCGSFALDFIVLWLYPAEYFVMVPKSRDKNTSGSLKKKSPTSLMSNRELLSQMKDKILWLISFGHYKYDDKSKQKHQKNNFANGIAMPNAVICAIKDEETTIDKRTQFIILMRLIKKDLRIPLYLLFFICSGATLAPTSYFFISLSNICHKQGLCEFSQLAGMLQVSMSIAETVVFVYIERTIKRYGRLNVCALGILLEAFKYGFYGTIYSSISPYYALAIEIANGVSFGIFLIISVQVAHVFANEVEFVLPELIAEGKIVGGKEREEKLKMSLAATMQSLVTSAQDGIGRGVGALIYGLILESYSFETLWVIVSTGSVVVFISLVAISIMCRILNIELGLDTKAMKKIAEVDEQSANDIRMETDSRIFDLTRSTLERTNSIKRIV